MKTEMDCDKDTKKESGECKVQEATILGDDFGRHPVRRAHHCLPLAVAVAYLGAEAAREHIQSWKFEVKNKS